MKYREYIKLLKRAKPYPKGVSWTFEDVLWNNKGLLFSQFN